MADMVDFGIQPGETLEVPVVGKGEKLLTVISEKQETSKEKDDGSGGRPMVHVEFEDSGDPAADTVHHYFMLPDKDAKAATNIRRKADWAAYCSAFGLDLVHDPEVVKVNRPKGWTVIGHDEFPKGSGRYRANILKFHKAA